MKSTLISIITKDGGRISSLLYSESPKENVVVLIHGACMNFLEGTSYFIPERTSSYDKYDFLSVNMRAHDLGYIVNHYDQREGWGWQTIEKNRMDIDAIYLYLIEKGYKKIIFCGHSWGGLVCLDYLKNRINSSINGLILLSPTISFKLLAEVNYRDTIEQTLEQAKKMTIDKKGDFIIPTNTKSPIPFMSAKTICEFMYSDFEAKIFLETIQMRVDIIVGGLEHKNLHEFVLELLEKNKSIYYYIINKSNHFYAGHESETVDLIDSILKEVVL
jgi:pimeloyl-ACP methyl ester carboxylesterase